MPIPNMTDVQMRAALKELEQALYNHEQWTENLYGTLICRLQPDERDIATNAHHNCRFGQWYYKSGVPGLERHPGFAEIGLEHERMHQYAATLLNASANREPISTKDFERFLTALKRMRLEIVTVQHEIEGALFNLDPLTGVHNRVDMLTKLREQHEFVRRHHPCAIAMMDLDLFKSVNDTYGHAAGDKVLVAFAHYIVNHLRPYDKVFRYGGEEFLLCLADTNMPDAAIILDRLRGELASLQHDVPGKAPFFTTVSVGVAALDANKSVEEAMDRADRALYAAKTKGRNCVIAWSPSMDEAADRR
ncbi:diguanylate cyclase [Microbacteriaceae bacterium K1510]|nr:diguanylate cyclase [Microbacteriaceae bacterium K1510]